MSLDDRSFSVSVSSLVLTISVRSKEKCVSDKCLMANMVLHFIITSVCLGLEKKTIVGINYWYCFVINPYCYIIT